MGLNEDDLTEEELEHLKDIKEILGKGYIRGYCVKMVHVCPGCGESKGFRGHFDPPMPENVFGFCRACDRPLTKDEWLNGPHKVRWMPLSGE